MVANSHGWILHMIPLGRENRLRFKDKPNVKFKISHFVPIRSMLEETVVAARGLRPFLWTQARPYLHSL